MLKFPIPNKNSVLRFIKNRKITLSVLAVLFTWFLFCLPSPLFKDSTSTILLDKNEQLLAARIAKDGQWRFPEIDSVPIKFETCITYFEDQYFRYHPGINPISLIKAIYINIRAGKVVRGGSTISSQVIRLSRKGKKRNVYEKLIEFILAVRLEVKCSKDEILDRKSVV